MFELAGALNRYLKGVLNRAKRPRSGHYDGPQRERRHSATRTTLAVGPDYSLSVRRQQRGADEIGLGGSDPRHYIWAAFSPKTGGRYRPIRGFRSRSFFSTEVCNSFLSEALARPVGERSAYL
jgi:hypothetical protein